jgi:hypothetical protein
MAKIIEERVASPDDPIYQTGWTIAYIPRLGPKPEDFLQHRENVADSLKQIIPLLNKQLTNHD